MKIKILVSVLVLLIIVNLVAIGTRVYNRWARPDGDFYRRSKLMPPPGDEGPKLSKEQREKLGNLLDNLRDETRDQHMRVRAVEDQIFEEVQKASPDSVRIDSLLQNLAQNQRVLSFVALKKMREAKTFLLPEQQRRFFNLLIRSRPPMRPGEPHRERMERP